MLTVIYKGKGILLLPILFVSQIITALVKGSFRRYLNLSSDSDTLLFLTFSIGKKLINELTK